MSEILFKLGDLFFVCVSLQSAEEGAARRWRVLRRFALRFDGQLRRAPVRFRAVLVCRAENWEAQFDCRSGKYDEAPALL